MGWRTFAVARWGSVLALFFGAGCRRDEGRAPAHSADACAVRDVVRARAEARSWTPEEYTVRAMPGDDPRDRVYLLAHRDDDAPLRPPGGRSVYVHVDERACIVTAEAGLE